MCVCLLAIYVPCITNLHSIPDNSTHVFKHTFNDVSFEILLTITRPSLLRPLAYFYFLVSASGGKAAEASNLKDTEGTKESRLANAEFIHHLDNSLRKSIKVSLSAALPTRRLTPLPQGHKRYLAHMPGPDGVLQLRSCIKNEHGVKYVEVPHRYDNEGN